MSDNLRRYHAIRNALVQAYPAPPTGNLARHLSTLAALISGIVGSKSTQLPHHRRESAQRDEARKPRQTLCQVVRQRPYLGRGIFFTLCGPLAPAFRPPDIGARHGWQCGGPRL